MSNPASSAAGKADHSIVINYAGNSLGPNPALLKVKLNKSIIFEEGDMPAGHTMHISFEHPEHFSAATFRKDDRPIVVHGRIPKGHGKYLCKLIKDGVVQPSDIPGGSLELDTDDQVNR